MTLDFHDYLILYVDDDRSNRVVFELTFKEFRVHCVTSGEEALAFIAQSKETIAVLVTDQRMAGMSGDELLRRVREISPDTLRMILTAYSDLEPILRAVNEGLVARYVIKPWDRDELAEILRWALEAHAIGRQNNALQLRLVQTERLRTLGQVCASVIHNLSQPVTAVSMSAGQLHQLADAAPLLERLAKSETPSALTDDERSSLGSLAAELLDVATTLGSCATFMSDLMKQMKHFHLRETEPPTNGDVAPLPVLELAITMCRSGGGPRVSYEGPAELPPLRATSMDVLQIFVNVIRNAQQALAEHDVQHGSVVLHAHVEPQQVTFVVEDNGPGIPPDVLPKLGTPFFTTRKDGTGLGINQCRSLVGRLGGTFKIESEIGRGTRVTVTLPRRAPSSDA